MPAIKRRVAHYIWPESETRLCPSETRRSLVAFSPLSPPHKLWAAVLLILRAVLERVLVLLAIGHGGACTKGHSSFALVRTAPQRMGRDPSLETERSFLETTSEKRRGGRANEQYMPSAQEGLSALCVKVDVNDRGAFLLAEYDERDSFSRPNGEGNGLVEEVVVVRDILLHVVRERVYRHLFASNRPSDG
jgi:hypothetical protein